MSTPALVIPPLLPQCLNGSLTQDSVDTARALEYAPNSWDYYKSVLPSIIPGLVLGVLSLIFLIFFVIWMSIQLCTCCCACCRKSSSHEEPESKSQFIKEEGSLGAEAFGVSMMNGRQTKQGSRSTRIMQVLIILLALATTGLSAWGIAASVDNTDTQISNFWALVDSVDNTLSNTTAVLRSLSTQLDTLQQSVDTISQDSGVTELAAQIPSIGSTVTSVLKEINNAKPEIDTIQQQIQVGIQSANSSIESALNQLRQDFKPPSLEFENTGRFVAIAVVFGITIVAALLSGWLSLRVHHPGWATCCVSMLWLMIILLMFLGVGLLRGIYVVSTDSCLYAETFVVRYVAKKVVDPQTKTFVDRALNYYFDPNIPDNQPVGSTINAVFGVDPSALLNILNNNDVQTLVSTLQGALSSSLLSSLNSSTANAAETLVTLVQPITDEVTILDHNLSRQAILPLYDQGKSFICCDISNAANDLFAAWTAVGCVGFVLGSLSSWRIMRITYKSRKSRS